MPATQRSGMKHPVHIILQVSLVGVVVHDQMSLYSREVLFTTTSANSSTSDSRVLSTVVDECH